MTKKKGYKLTIIFGAFLFFIYIMSTIPFGSDDWAWGTSVGMERLASHFAGYNGRYLGNLLIIFLTKNAFIKTIGMAVISFAVVLLIYEYIGKDRFLYFLFPLLLLFFMPANVFRQTMAWASGLANYIPPVIAILLYLNIVKNIFSQDKPVYSKILIPFSFAIGICGNLFMEHNTILNITLSLAIIIYSYIKFKSVFAVHISNFLGNVIGFVIMFSDGKIEAIEFAAGRDIKFLNKSISTLKIKKDILIAAIQRKNKTIFPTGSDVIKENDRVIIVSKDTKIYSLNDILS